MADSRQAELLLAAIEHAAGRQRWNEYRTRTAGLDLSGAELIGLTLRNFDLSAANLSTAQFDKADLTAADLSRANLTLAQLAESCLRDAMLEHANFTGANFHDADLADAKLEGANCYNTNFAGANLIGADFGGADLREANLTGACLKFCRFSGALLTGANVAGADLTGSVLDPDHPSQLLNFSEATIDDRRYRQMRNRFADLFGEVEAQEASDAGLTVAVHKRQAEISDFGSGASDASGESAPRLPNSLPLAPELNLSTIEGCCAMLGVTPEASMEDVARAFRKKAKIYHPDKVRHLNVRLQELAALEFQRLHVAYETLTRKTTRPLVGIIWPSGLARQASPQDYSSAEYEELLRLNPANVNIMYNLAYKYFEENRAWDAKVWFEKILQLDPHDEDAHFNLIIIRIYLEIQLPLLGG